MVPDKFNMVDMEGIDLLESQGLAVTGLYQKLVDSTAQCRYQCLYNWKFDGIIIPPTYVEMTATDESISINGGVSVDVNDVVHIESLVVPIVIEPLTVSENGTYTPEEGVDGFAPVEVEVEVNPVIESLEVSENGEYTVSEGVDGFNPVVVNVSASVSKYQLQSPIHYDFVGGYVASGIWYTDAANTARTDIYRVYAGKHYIIHLGSTVGNRFRSSFFATDPALATGTLNGSNIADIDNPQPYNYGCTVSSRVMYSPSSDGFVAIGKTNQPIDGLMSYLVEFEE